MNNKNEKEIHKAGSNKDSFGQHDKSVYDESSSASTAPAKATQT